MSAPRPLRGLYLLTPEAYQRSPLQWALIAMVIVGGFGIIGLAVWEFIAEERREAELECQRAEQRASYLINEPTTGMDTPEELRASADELFAASDAVEEAC